MVKDKALKFWDKFGEREPSIFETFGWVVVVDILGIGPSECCVATFT